MLITLNFVKRFSEDFGIARGVDSEGNPVNLVGPIGEYPLFCPVEIPGVWGEHPKYGRQFRVEPPTTLQGKPLEFVRELRNKKVPESELKTLSGLTGFSDKVEENPYQFLPKISVKFRVYDDAVLRVFPIADDDPRRLEAILCAALRVIATEGSTAATGAEIRQSRSVGEMLGKAKPYLARAVEAGVRFRVWDRPPTYQLPEFSEAETRIVKALKGKL